MPEPAEIARGVRAAVAGRRPTDARERVSIAEFLRRFDALDQPFLEEADPVHVTASALLVAEDRSRILLHRHKRLGLWLQPGGHIDPDELPWDAARREAEEETGLPVALSSTDLAHVDVHPGPRGHTHLDLRYLITSPVVAPSPAEGESQEAQWFPWYRAISIADVGLEGALRMLQPGQPVIRRARGAEATDVAHVYLRSREFALPTVAVVHDDEDVRRWVGDDVIGRLDTWVADLDGTVVGMMALDRGRDDAGWIEQLYLDPAWIGRGLGARFADLAKQRYPGGLELWTFQANEPALRFYRSHGFVEMERTDGAGNENHAPDARLLWKP